MNTPLNDALKPCPFCGGEAEFERMGDPGQSCIVVCRSCSTRHESSDEGLHNGSSWNARANTPESSAAQGAMGDADTIRTEANQLSEILLGMIEGGDADDGVDIYADDYQAADGDVFVARAAKILALVAQGGVTESDRKHVEEFSQYLRQTAQPSDATAQPRVDLTDERIVSAIHKVVAMANKDDEHDYTHNAIDVIRSLLANTAQGKPTEDSEIVTHIIEHGIRGSTYKNKTSIEVIVDVDVLESQGPRAALVSALAAKKG